MKEYIIALAIGLIVGFIFSMFKAPTPAPGSFAGVIGIFGIVAGYKFGEWLVKALS